MAAQWKLVRGRMSPTSCAVQRAGDHHVRIHRGIDHAGALDQIEHPAGVDGERRRAEGPARAHHLAEGAGIVLGAGRQLQAVPGPVVLGGGVSYTAARPDGPRRRRCAGRRAAPGRGRRSRRRASNLPAGRGRNRPRPRRPSAGRRRPPSAFFMPSVSGRNRSARRFGSRRRRTALAQACSGSAASFVGVEQGGRPPAELGGVELVGQGDARRLVLLLLRSAWRTSRAASR